MPMDTWSATYKCPCKAGTVTRTVVDYDKMYVPDDITISWSCKVCEAQYRQVLSSLQGMVAIKGNGEQVVLESAV